MTNARAKLCLSLLFLSLGAACERPADPGLASEGIVFIRSGEGGGDPWQARLADGAERRLLATPGRDESWPYWSAALGRVVIQLPPRGRNGPQLALLDPESGETTPLPGTGEPVQNWPAWSPDGRQLAYAFRTRVGAGIAIVEPEGGRREILARGRLVRPTFAPDGARLVAQGLSGDGGSKLFVLEGGREPRVLVAGGGYDDKGRFTRDGAFVVFQRGAKRDAPRDVLRAPPGGGDALAVVEAPESDDHGADPSPTRDEIVFVSNRDGSSDLFLMPLAGGAPRNLTRSPDVDELAPHWSPDGERIAFTVKTPGKKGETRVRVVERDGRARYDAPGMMPSWMPPWP